jgi:uncharacterized membrane protein YeaQ/YmgE (transglycosylase-associated protein family)
MPLWTLIVWIVLGGLAGFFATKILGGKSPYGVIGDVVLGLIGAVAGGYGLSLLGIAGNGGLIATFVVALVGAVAILWAVRQLKKSA